MLTRYKGHGPSMFTLYKRSNSSPILQKLGYLTNKQKKLKPLTESQSSENLNAEDPIADVGIMNSAIRSVPLFHYGHHQDIEMDELPVISPPINNSNRELFYKKLEQCSVMCDFADPEVDLNAKRIKMADLQEIERIFSDENALRQLTKEDIDRCFQMINTNLFRGIVIIDKKYLIYDDEPPIEEVTWPHLQIVYSLLLNFQKTMPKDPHINSEYLKKVYTLLEAPDIQERNCVLDFLKKFIEIYPDTIPNMLRHFEAIVREYVDRLISPFPILPILNIFLVILKKPNHDTNLTQTFFKNAIIPLISAQHIVSYYPLMSEIFNIFIEKDPEYTKTIIKRLVEVFPQSCPSKQQLFIAWINAVTGKLQPEEFETIGPIIFGLYANLATSSNAKIVQASLKIWSDVKIIPMIMDNTQTILPIIFPNVQNVMKNHWNQQARNAALEALNSMHDYDPFIYDELSQKAQNGAVNEKIASTQVPKHRNWALIARLAARQDGNLNLAKILADIQVKFSEVATNTDKKGKRSSQNIKPKIITPPTSASYGIRT